MANAAICRALVRRSPTCCIPATRRGLTSDRSRNENQLAAVIPKEVMNGSHFSQASQSLEKRGTGLLRVPKGAGMRRCRHASLNAARQGRVRVLVVVCLLLLCLLGIRLWMLTDSKNVGPRPNSPSAEKMFAARPLTTPNYRGDPPISIDANFDDVSADELAVATKHLQQFDSSQQEASERLLHPQHHLPYFEGSSSRETVRQLVDDGILKMLLDSLVVSNLPPDIHGQAEEFVRKYSDFVVRGTDPVEPSELNELAERQLQLSPDDPLITALAARVIQETTNDRRRADELYEQALRGLVTGEYPAGLEVHVREGALWNGWRRGPEFEMRFPPLLIAIMKWLEEESNKSSVSDAVRERFLEIWHLEIGSSLRGQLAIALTQSDRVDPWIKHFASGDQHTEIARQIRRGRPTLMINLEEMQSLRQHFHKARTHLEYCWFLRPDLPDAAANLIEVEKELGDQQSSPKVWFHRTLEIRPDYENAYWDYWSSLRPRWGGHIAEMKALIAEMAYCERFDLWVPYGFVQFADNLKRTEDAGKDYIQSAEFRTLVQHFLSARERFEASQQDIELFDETPRFHDKLGAILERLGMYEAAAREYARAERFYDANLLYDRIEDGLHHVLRLHAAQGDLRQRVLDFDHQVFYETAGSQTLENLPGLRAELMELRKSASNDYARRYYQFAEFVLDSAEQFHQGNTIPLAPSKNAVQWHFHQPRRSHESEAGLVLQFADFDSSESILASPAFSAVPPFELNWVLEPLDGSQVSTFRVEWQELHAASEEGETPRHPWLEVNSGVVIRNDGARVDAMSAVLPKAQMQLSRRQYELRKQPGPLRCRMRVWPEYVEGTVEGAWSSSQLARTIHPDGQLLLELTRDADSGANLHVPVHAGVLLSECSIQRLELEPEPASGDPQDLVNYWRRRHALDSDDVVAIGRLSEVLLSLRQFQEVIAFVDASLEQNPNMKHLRGIQGRAFFELGDYSSALASLDGQVAWDTHARVYATLAEILAAAPDESLRDLQQALYYAQEADSISYSGDAEALAALGVVYAALGNFEQARTANARAIELADYEITKKALEDRQLKFERGEAIILPGDTELTDQTTR